MEDGSSFKCPILVFLSSASLNLRFAKETPGVLRWVLERGNYHVLPLARPHRALKITRTTSSYVCIVLGSGGHTAEMPSLLHSIDLDR
jgi:hypothetical protein